MHWYIFINYRFSLIFLIVMTPFQLDFGQNGGLQVISPERLSELR